MDIDKVLEDHKLWVNKQLEGKRANLSDAKLYWAKLSNANLSWADLSKANLCWANISNANLSNAKLYWAKLSGADLSWAKLSNADLSGADLCWADLSGANLYGAKGIVRLGPSTDGYEFFGVNHGETVMIKAGCRWFSVEEAKEHWTKTRGGTKLGLERIRFVEFIEAHFSE